MEEEVAHLKNTSTVKPENKSTAKRDAANDGDENPKKRVKMDGPQPSNPQLKAASETGGLPKMTVAVLKDVLTIRGLPVHGKKADLVERLDQWIGENL